MLTLICIILHYYLLPSLSLRLLQLSNSIAVGAVDLDDCMVFSLTLYSILLAFGKINLTWHASDLLHSTVQAELQ